MTQKGIRNYKGEKEEKRVGKILAPEIWRKSGES